LGNSKDYLTFTIKGKDEFSGTMDKLGSKLSAAKVPILAIGAAAAASAVGVFALTKNVADSFDKVQKFSDRIGISTEAMSKLNHIADLSGISTQAMGTSIQRMTRRISEASVGTGVAVKALEELGISVDSIKNKKPDEQFADIADAMHGMEKQSDKVRLAMALFDTEGVSMLQSMKDGSKGIKEMGDEAEKLGLVISGDAGEAAANFNDSMLRMSSSIKGISNTMAVELMPVMTRVMNGISKLVVDNKETFAALGEGIKTAFNGVVISIKGVVHVLMFFKEAIVTVKGTMESFFETTTKGWDSFVDGAKGALTAIGAVESEMIKINEAAAQAASPYSWDDNSKGYGSKQETSSASDNNLPDITGLSLKGGLIGKLQEEQLKTTIDNIRKTKKEIIAQVSEVNQILSESSALKDDASNGLYPFTDLNVARSNENILNENENQKIALENLRVIYEEHTLSEDERLELWREEELARVDDHEEGKRMIEEMYAAKKKKNEDKRRKIKAKDEQKDQAKKELLQKQANERELAVSNKRYDNLHSLATLFGKKGAVLSSALAIFQTRNDTKAAAISAYKAMAGIPVVGPALGAAAAAAAIAFGNSQVAAISGNLLGIAHDGMDYIPREGTYLLDRGEKVLSPRQNIDLTNFLDDEKTRNGGGGNRPTAIDAGLDGEQGNITINIEVLPNATNADAMLSMDKNDWEDIVIDQIMPAMAILKKQGMDYETI